MTTHSAYIVVLIVLAALAAALIVAVFARRRRFSRAELQRRFGPEYTRAVEQFGSKALAERALAARADRVAHFHVHELDEASRARFTATWSAVQSRFVDDPVQAAQQANELIKEVMRRMGYPADEFQKRTEDLSVDHGNVVQHYRAAHALTASNRAGHIDTEELRQAIVHYRAIVAELLAPPRSEQANEQTNEHVNEQANEWRNGAAEAPPPRSSV